MRGKIYQSTKLQNISWNFVEMVGDSHPCDDFINFDRKVDQAYKNRCLQTPRREHKQHAICHYIDTC